jgi:uncharacterized protein (TIGR01777 family)
MYSALVVKIAVSGASGMIGSALVPALRARGHEVLRLVRREPVAADEVGWDPAAGTIDAEALEGTDAALHLSGRNIGQRWSEKVKREVLASRVDTGRLLARTLASLDPTPATLVSAGAVGYYGNRGDEELTEESARGEGFMADVCEAWEGSLEAAREAGMRVVVLRQGIVLSRIGGALPKLLTPFKLGLGGRVGSGAQWWPWVTLEDLVRVYEHALTGDLEGPVNVAAPGAVTNAELTKALGRALGRPTLLPLPASAVKVMFGQMGVEALLGGQRAIPAKLVASGFTFSQPTIDAGLAKALE